MDTNKLEDLKIVGMMVENIKKIKLVDIKPDGTLMVVSGDNASGKTSLLEAIPWAIKGKGGIQFVPIREGQERALIRLDLGEVVVTRTFKKKGDVEFTTEVKVESADGAEYKSPQTILDSLVGWLSFSPIEFERMDQKGQLEVLKKFVDGFDFSKAAGDREKLYQERTVLNRKASEKRAAANAIQLPPPGAKHEAKDESEILKRLTGASTKNTKIGEEKQAREEMQKKNVTDLLGKAKTRREGSAEAKTAADLLLKSADEEFESAKKKHENALIAHANSLTAREGQLREAETWEKQAHEEQDRINSFAPLEPLEDAEAIAKELEAAKETNAVLAKVQQREKLEKEAKEFEDASQQVSDDIEKIDSAKVKAIAEAKMPVEGLTIKDDMVMLNGVPFEQASDAERLTASVCLAMAANPKLKVISIRDGSLLDAKAMLLIAKLAKKNDYQVWVERVEPTGQVGIVMEDGMVKGASDEQETKA